MEINKWGASEDEGSVKRPCTLVNNCTPTGCVTPPDNLRIECQLQDAGFVVFGVARHVADFDNRVHVLALDQAADQVQNEDRQLT
jgi:hypothetical protein